VRLPFLIHTLGFLPELSGFALVHWALGALARAKVGVEKLQKKKENAELSSTLSQRDSTPSPRPRLFKDEEVSERAG
jgi:hypothetical protein